MPPEQFPWDRRDFRKHDRSGSDTRFGGGGGFGGGWTHRWREPQHHPHAPPPFQHHHNHPPQQPWYSDFRTSRPIPPGHGKQGGWNMYPDEGGPVFMPFGSRYNDRDVADDNFRPFGSHGDAKYLRNNRDSRGSVSQKDWRSHSWEPAVSSSGPGRPTTEVNNQKAVENTKVNNQKAVENTKVNNQKAVENAETCYKTNNQKAGENAQTCYKASNQNASENTQTCHKANNQKAGENAQNCYKASNQNACESTQICHKANNQKAGGNAQTCYKASNQNPGENVPGENVQTFHMANNQKAGENAQTFHKTNNPKVGENAQTCHKVNNQKVGENAQTCNEVNNQKVTEDAETCYKANNKKAVENSQTCHKANNGKAAENAQTCHKNDSESNDSAHPLPDLLSSPSQPLSKEKHAKKDVAAAGTLGSSGHNSDKENGLGSINWKPLKWSRSGSLVSRGSGFSHSSSSKSLGVESTDILADLQQKDVTPVQSPAACVMPNKVPDPSDDTTSRKKPRLGWGEGLAKYEKKKVDGPEEDAGKDRLVFGVTSTGTMLSPSMSQVDKSPRFAYMSDCASPATPASVACSSSPGITGSEEKEYIKAASVDHSAANLSCSPGIMSQTYHDGPAFNLENLELTSIANLSLLINDLLQSNDPSSVETGYMWTTSLNKLLVCKVNILKALEVTESEIDSLETELKSLSAGSNGRCPCQAAYSSQSRERLLEPCEEHAATSGYTGVPVVLQIASPGNMVDEDTPAALEEENMEAKDEEIDSLGTATSKLVEAPFPGGDTCTPKTIECVEGSDQLGLDNSSNLNQTCNGPCYEDNVCPADASDPILSYCENNSSVGNVRCDCIYDSILASNKESVKSYVEGLNKLLPDKKGVVGSSTLSRVSSFQRDSSVIKERFLARKWSHKFKESVITLKFKVFQHFWKEGRVVSVRKLRGKAHKMFDPSRTGYRKNRSSIQSRISYFAGSHQIVPAEDVIEFLNGLLSALPFKPCRNSLRMPCFLLEKEVRMSRFISNNGLVEDPGIAEKERSIINPWMAEEQEIFIEKLAIFGKNFSKIASFLERKSIADCIEFYYKNHKSECFVQARKKPDKQSKPQATTYLVAAGKRSNREVNAVNLDILGDASIIAAAVNDGIETQPKSRSRILLDASSSRILCRGDDGPFQRSNSPDLYSNETAAADVLAGICGSLSSEAMSSCITSSFDPARANSRIKQPLTPDVTQNVDDDECSDESCAEIDTTDWTDEEKSIFIRAMSSYGKDFARISQCLGTKTNEQCKIFFSKARKCLGLDQIHPAAGNADSSDVNGGGSDIEDGCIAQNGYVLCSDDSENKIEENHTCHEMKIAHTPDTAESHKMKSDVNVCAEGSRTCPLDSMAATPVLKNSSESGYQVDDKPVTDVNASNREQSGADGSDLGVKTICVSSYSNSLQVEHGVDHGLLRSGVADNKASAEIALGNVPGNLKSNKGEYQDANLVDVAFSCGLSELKPEHQLAGNVSHPSADAHSSMQVESGPQNEADLESCSAEASHVISSQENVDIACMESCTLFSVPIKFQTHSVGNALPNMGINGINKKYLQANAMTGDSQQQRSGNPLLESIESSQILSGYPVPVHAMKDLNVDVNSQKLVLPQDVPIRDGMLHLGQHTDLSLQKCTGSRHLNEVFKVPFSSQERCCGDKSRPQSGFSSGSDKPARNGDVKLFGKILVSSHQEPSSSLRDFVPDDVPDNTRHHKTSGQLLNLKLSGDDKVHLHPSKLNFDCNNYLGAENIPVGSFNPWDGSQVQTGFPLLDSTLLLTKYPAAFANHSIPATKLEQSPLCRVSESNDRPLNGVSVIPRELKSNIGLPEFPVLQNGELQQQPLTADMRQPQDAIFSGMHRRNGFEIMTGMQQQARMMAGINNVMGRGVVLPGDQYHPGASNPMNAVKMHYGNAQNFNVQTDRTTNG